MRNLRPNAPREGFCLSAASCLWRRALCGYWLSLFLQLFDDPARPRGIDVDAGPHRSRQRDPMDVAALRSRRLRAQDLVEDCDVVLDELALAEALLADRHVDVRAAVRSVLELAGLRLAHGLRDVERDRARLRIRHEA